MTEFNLSDKIHFSNGWEINVSDVKRFIEQDEELINKFACGQITLTELKEEREKLAGKKFK